MFDSVDDFRKKAVDNKAALKRQSVEVFIGDKEQKFRISGIGEKAIKIEAYIKYDDIMETVKSEIEDSLDATLMKIVEDFEEE